MRLDTFFQITIFYHHISFASSADIWIINIFNRKFFCYLSKPRHDFECWNLESQNAVRT